MFASIMTKKRIMFIVAAFCCVFFSASAQSSFFPWLAIEQKGLTTTSTLDKNYQLVPYVGDELCAGIVCSKILFQADSVPETTTYFEGAPISVSYTNAYGHVEKEELDTIAEFIQLNYVGNFKHEHSLSLVVLRGGRYTYHCCSPYLGWDYSKTVDILDNPSVRFNGISCIVGQNFDAEVDFNTGYPYDVSKFTGNKKASLTLYSIAEGKDGEIGRELATEGKQLNLYRPDQPLVAAVDTMRIKVENMTPGKYRMVLNSDWAFEDANTSFVFSVNDTLRATAQMDKDHYDVSDKEAHVTVNMDYGYPHIALPEGEEKPKLTVKCLIVDNQENEGVLEKVVLDKIENVISNDSLATNNLNETMVFDIPLQELINQRKSKVEDPLEIYVGVYFNDANKASFNMPFYCTGTATGINETMVGQMVDCNCYDLQGRKVPNDNKKKGLYVRGGMKILVK